MIEQIKPWYRLSLDSSTALRSDFVWPTLDPDIKRREFFYSNPADIMSNDWLEFWTSMQSNITSVILFWRAAGSDHGWAHIDVNAKRYVTTCAINWAYDNGSTEMVWYDSPGAAEIADRPVNIAPGNTHNLAFEIADLHEISRCNIGTQPTLVRTNMPHTVLVGNSSRWGVSMRFGGRYQLWDHAVDYLVNDRGLGSGC